MNITWTKQALRTLRETSDPGNWKEMVRQWLYKGEVTDLENLYDENHGTSSTCGLCGHPNLRFNFPIYNSSTGATLIVGSSCITKFQIPLEDVTLNHNKFMAQREHYAKSKYTLDYAKETMKLIKRADSTGLLQEHFKKTGKVLTMLALDVAQFMNGAGMSDRLKYLSVSLRKNEDKEYFMSLSDDDFGTTTPLLSSSQVSSLVSLRERTKERAKEHAEEHARRREYAAKADAERVQSLYTTVSPRREGTIEAYIENAITFLKELQHRARDFPGSSFISYIEQNQHLTYKQILWIVNVANSLHKESSIPHLPVGGANMLPKHQRDIVRKYILLTPSAVPPY